MNEVLFGLLVMMFMMVVVCGPGNWVCFRIWKKDTVLIGKIAEAAKRDVGLLWVAQSAYRTITPIMIGVNLCFIPPVIGLLCLLAGTTTTEMVDGYRPVYFVYCIVIMAIFSVTAVAMLLIGEPKILIPTWDRASLSGLQIRKKLRRKQLKHKKY